MKRDATQEVDRRTWLVGCARTVVLGGIAVASGVLVMRGQVRGCSRETTSCASCQELSRCELRRAAAVRDQLAKKGNC